MRWDRTKRKYWDFGDADPFFRMSKIRCQKLMQALVMCDGQIHDSFSLSVWQGEVKYNQRPHEIEVHFRISLPIGAEALFQEIAGAPITEPPKVQVN